MIGSVAITAANGETVITIDGFCLACRRLLCHGEYLERVCWWCSPELAPPDLEEHLKHLRQRARARARRPAYDETEFNG